jgi:hypothetical protein
LKIGDRWARSTPDDDELERLMRQLKATVSDRDDIREALRASETECAAEHARLSSALEQARASLCKAREVSLSGIAREVQ